MPLVKVQIFTPTGEYGAALKCRGAIFCERPLQKSISMRPALEGVHVGIEAPVNVYRLPDITLPGHRVGYGVDADHAAICCPGVEPTVTTVVPPLKARMKNRTVDRYVTRTNT